MKSWPSAITRDPEIMHGALVFLRESCPPRGWFVERLIFPRAHAWGYKPLRELALEALEEAKMLLLAHY